MKYAICIVDLISIRKGEKFEVLEEFDHKIIINRNGEAVSYARFNFDIVDIKNDEVNNPQHYTQGKIETIDFIEDMGFLEGNIIKYVSRYKYKNGLQDLEKAKWYLERLIKNIEGVNNDT